MPKRKWSLELTPSKSARKSGGRCTLWPDADAGPSSSGPHSLSRRCRPCSESALRCARWLRPGRAACRQTWQVDVPHGPAPWSSVARQLKLGVVQQSRRWPGPRSAVRLSRELCGERAGSKGAAYAPVVLLLDVLREAHSERVRDAPRRCQDEDERPHEALILRGGSLRTGLSELRVVALDGRHLIEDVARDVQQRRRLLRLHLPPLGRVRQAQVQHVPIAAARRERCSLAAGTEAGAAGVRGAVAAVAPAVRRLQPRPQPCEPAPTSERQQRGAAQRQRSCVAMDAKRAAERAAAQAAPHRSERATWVRQSEPRRRPRRGHKPSARRRPTRRRTARAVTASRCCNCACQSPPARWRTARAQSGCGSGPQPACALRALNNRSLAIESSARDEHDWSLCLLLLADAPVAGNRSCAAWQGFVMQWQAKHSSDPIRHSAGGTCGSAAQSSLGAAAACCAGVEAATRTSPLSEPSSAFTAPSATSALAPAGPT